MGTGNAKPLLPDDAVLGACLLQGEIPETLRATFRADLFLPERQPLARALLIVSERLGACPLEPVKEEMAAQGAGVREIMAVASILGAGALPDELSDLFDALQERERRKAAEQSPVEVGREGLDLVLAWPDGISFRLAAIRDGREGTRGELTVICQGRRLSWGAWSLASTTARESLRKKLDSIASRVNWGARLEEAAWRFTEAARQGEPLVTLTGCPTVPTREVVPRLLYEGEPTVIYGDGDTGKSLFSTALAVSVHSGTPLLGLRPGQAVPVAYLDWETSRDTLEERLGKLAAGLGIPPPAILYKRMTRPLADEAGVLAAEFAKRGIRFIIADSMMFAVASGEGVGFHEPIIAFYNALRLFAPAAVLVLNHITGDDARRGGAGRPFGGAFAFNAPRLIWEAKRDRNVPDATAIGFTCRKANNLPRLPEPFGLLFKESKDAITVQALNLAEASPDIVAGATLAQRLNLALRSGALTTPELKDRIAPGSSDGSFKVTLHLLQKEGKIVQLEKPAPGRPAKWGLPARTG